MKNRILFLVALTAFGLCGCSDYLDKAPLDSNSDATNWSSESALKTYSWRLYDDLGDWSYGQGGSFGQYFRESLTDDYASEDFSQFTKNVPAASSSWNSPYENIREANILLSRVDRVPNLTEAAANHWKGVARFFRALHFFDLVKTYGDVVWVDKELSFGDPAKFQLPRDSRVTVMDNVVADLEFAMNNCYTPAKADANTVNSLVAAAFLSRAALYEGTWEKYHNTANGHPDVFLTKAKDAAEKVISSGLYSIITTVKGASEDEYTAGYKKNYMSEDLKGNTEMLLYKEYVYNSAITSAHPVFGYSASSTPTWGLTKSAVENYTDADGLPIHMSASYDDKTLNGIFGNRDARLAQTVHPKLLPVTSVEFAEGILSTTGYWSWKFVPLSEYKAQKAADTWNAPRNTTDGPVFAYPEVLLNYAEACAELGKPTQDDLDKSVNELRTKHGLIPALTLVGTDGCSVNGTTITKDPNNQNGNVNVLLQEIRRERRSELMCDGFRQADLYRWALGANLDFVKNPDGYLGVSKAAIEDFAAQTYTFENVTYPVSPFDDTKGFWVTAANGEVYKSPYNTPAVGSAGTTVNRVWDDKNYLEPIPSGQQTLDPNLGQNPKW